MEFKKGIPPKEPINQYILEMKNHPVAVGAWNNEEGSFIIASLQCSERNNEPYDCWYDTEFIEEKDIVGWIELP